MKKNGYTLVELIIVLVFVFSVFGYCLNIYKLSSCDFDFNKSNKAEIIRGIGVFTPLGSVIGYMDFSNPDGDR